MMTVATMRGITSFFIGSVPSARIASICSVTTIEPSSDAMPEALRPEIISEVRTGPNSLIIESDTSVPVSAVAPKVASDEEDCRARTRAGKEAGQNDNRDRPTPMMSAWVKISLT